MRQTIGTRKSPDARLVKDIKRATRKQYSSKEKIRITLEGLRSENSIAEMCRRIRNLTDGKFQAVREISAK